MSFITTLLFKRNLNFAKVVLSTAVLLCSVVSIDAKSDSFKWVRSVQQQTVRDYSSGLSAYYENGVWGFVSPEGNVVIAPA